MICFELQDEQFHSMATAVSFGSSSGNEGWFLSLVIIFSRQRKLIIIFLLLFPGMESTDLLKFPDISFAEVEGYAQKASGCEHTRKAYKFFAEPGYIHDKKGKLNVIINFHVGNKSLSLSLCTVVQ